VPVVAAVAPWSSATSRGLIAGAAREVGLGHAFLRHVERCHVLLHVLDVLSSVAWFRRINALATLVQSADLYSSCATATKQPAPSVIAIDSHLRALSRLLRFALTACAFIRDLTLATAFNRSTFINWIQPSLIQINEKDNIVAKATDASHGRHANDERK